MPTHWLLSNACRSPGLWGKMEWFLIKRSCRQKVWRRHGRMLHRKLTLLYQLLRKAALGKLANPKWLWCPAQLQLGLYKVRLRQCLWSSSERPSEIWHSNCLPVRWILPSTGRVFEHLDLSWWWNLHGWSLGESQPLGGDLKVFIVQPTSC